MIGTGLILSNVREEMTDMNYAYILSQARKGIKIDLMDNKDKSVELVDEDVFYIEPMFKDITYNTSANAIIFSAPGATGKSSLAKKIAFAL